MSGWIWGLLAWGVFIVWLLRIARSNATRGLAPSHSERYEQELRNRQDDPS